MICNCFYGLMVCSSEVVNWKFGPTIGRLLESWIRLSWKWLDQEGGRNVRVVRLVAAFSPCRPSPRALAGCMKLILKRYIPMRAKQTLKLIRNNHGFKCVYSSPPSQPEVGYSRRLCPQAFSNLISSLSIRLNFFPLLPSTFRTVITLESLPGVS